jgi:hypothetical protein
MGGVGVLVHCRGAGHSDHPPTAPWRRFADVDFIGRHDDVTQIKAVFIDRGYGFDSTLNTLHGRYRLVFEHPTTQVHVDVLLDVFRMCHELPLVDRLSADRPTIPLADLLLTKLQIVQLNRKDQEDALILLDHHAVGDTDLELINGPYIASLCANDWGLYRTVTGNLQRLLQSEDLPLGVSADSALARAREVLAVIDDAPKTFRWRLRARVGDRYPWYEEVEEVNR